jgi:hypothetical protein
MRILVAFALLLGSCGALPQKEVLCSQSDRCQPSDGGVSSIGIGTGTGCRAGNGFDLGGGAWACPGTFGQPGPTAPALCAAGYAPCTTAGTANLGTCSQLTGFFIASAQGSLAKGDTNPADVQCNVPPPSSKDGLLWMGCGSALAGGTALIAGMSCDGFTSYLDCRGNNAFNCSYNTPLAGVSNTSTANGVLCCRP